jgi:hypothetical protein
MNLNKYTFVRTEEIPNDALFTVMLRTSEDTIGTFFALYYKMVKKGSSSGYAIRIGYNGEEGERSRGFTVTDKLVILPSLPPEHLVAWMKLEGWNLPPKDSINIWG